MGHLDRCRSACVVGGEYHQPCSHQVVDHSPNGGLLTLRDDELRQQRPAPRVLGALTRLGQPQQHLTGDRLLVCVERRIRLIGPVGECPADTARRGVRLEGQRARSAASPQLEQQMLHQRERTGLICDIGQDPANQPALEVEAGPSGGLLDRLS